RFWRYVVAALDRARPGLARRVGPPPPGSVVGLVPGLVNRLAAGPGPVGVLLVLDDFHLVGSGPAAASGGVFLENLRRGFVVVGRGERGGGVGGPAAAAGAAAGPGAAGRAARSRPAVHLRGGGGAAGRGGGARPADRGGGGAGGAHRGVGGGAAAGRAVAAGAGRRRRVRGGGQPPSPVWAGPPGP